MSPQAASRPRRTRQGEGRPQRGPCSGAGHPVRGDILAAFRRAMITCREIPLAIRSTPLGGPSAGPPALPVKGGPTTMSSGPAWVGERPEVGTSAALLRGCQTGITSARQDHRAKGLTPASGGLRLRHRRHSSPAALLSRGQFPGIPDTVGHGGASLRKLGYCVPVCPYSQCEHAQRAGAGLCTALRLWIMYQRWSYRRTEAMPPAPLTGPGSGTRDWGHGGRLLTMINYLFWTHSTLPGRARSRPHRSPLSVRFWGRGRGHAPLAPLLTCENSLNPPSGRLTRLDPPPLDDLGGEDPARHHVWLSTTPASSVKCRLAGPILRGDVAPRARGSVIREK